MRKKSAAKNRASQKATARATRAATNASKSESKVVANSSPKDAVCPKGGDHEWKEEDGKRFCAKCFEPGDKATAADKKTGKAKKAEKNGKLSAIDAAAKVLKEAGAPMGTKDMITAMAEKGYWTSPGGKTPHATLYSAILREIEKKGKESRFARAEKGTFTIRS